jgi:hypothetical protein
MVATARLGVEHVSSGSDHLLFLMLLLPAPLVASAGHWRRGPSARRSAIRVVHVVSAFAIGHSTTLILAHISSPSRRVGQDCRNASRSALIVSACVVGMPCGNPL